MKLALLSFVHIDFGGHGANDVVVAQKKRTLDPKVFVSKRHCGSNATGLWEACKNIAVDEQLTGWHCNRSTFLQTSGHLLRLVQATAEVVRRYMDAPTGNTSPNSEAEELCHQFATRFRNWNAFDEKTMCTDARSSDEDHEPLPHRQGEEAGVEGMFRKRKQWGRKRYVEIWDQFMEFFPKASVPHRPSRAQEIIMLSRA